MRPILTRDPNNLPSSVLAALPFLVSGPKGDRLITNVPDAHEAAHCRENRNCTGAGCRIRTAPYSRHKL